MYLSISNFLEELYSCSATVSSLLFRSHYEEGFLSLVILWLYIKMSISCFFSLCFISLLFTSLPRPPRRPFSLFLFLFLGVGLWSVSCTIYTTSGSIVHRLSVNEIRNLFSLPCLIIEDLILVYLNGLIVFLLTFFRNFDLNLYVIHDPRLH